MYKLLLFALLLTVIFADRVSKAHHRSHHSEFKAWKAKHGITYEHTEERYRMFLYKLADAEINVHNSNTLHGWTMAHNQFSGLTYEEFSKRYLGAIPPNQNV